jgi:hypothetical protein
VGAAGAGRAHSAKSQYTPAMIKSVDTVVACDFSADEDPVSNGHGALVDTNLFSSAHLGSITHSVCTAQRDRITDGGRRTALMDGRDSSWPIPM